MMLPFIFAIVKSFDGSKKLGVLPAEITLLNIYRELYTPGYVDQWEEFLISDENQLFQHLRSREQLIRKGAAEPSEPSEPLDRKVRTRIEMLIMEKFIVNNSKCVLIGEHALFIIMKDAIKTNIIQICTTEDLETILSQLKDIFEADGIKVNLTMKDQQLNIMKDLKNFSMNRNGG